MNKLYRTPRTPNIDAKGKNEKTWVLDCVAVRSIANDYSVTNPKWGTIIPPYYSQKDKHVKSYFKLPVVKQALRFYDQERDGSSWEAGVGMVQQGLGMDKFQKEGLGSHYLSNRNRHGAGYSYENSISGHDSWLVKTKPICGWNGTYGFRRNTPWLRQKPSPFGVATNSPIFDETTWVGNC